MTGTIITFRLTFGKSGIIRMLSEMSAVRGSAPMMLRLVDWMWTGETDCGWLQGWQGAANSGGKQGGRRPKLASGLTSSQYVSSTITMSQLGKMQAMSIKIADAGLQTDLMIWDENDDGNADWQAAFHVFTSIVRQLYDTPSIVAPSSWGAAVISAINTQAADRGRSLLLVIGTRSPPIVPK
jgi:hypothetical protein